MDLYSHDNKMASVSPTKRTPSRHGSSFHRDYLAELRRAIIEKQSLKDYDGLLNDVLLPMHTIFKLFAIPYAIGGPVQQAVLNYLAKVRVCVAAESGKQPPR